MAEVKISELPAAGSVTDTDELPGNQAGTTRKLTVAQLKSEILADLTLTGDVTSVGQVTTIAPNSIVLGTDTTGGYAASATEGGPASSVAANSVALGTDTTGNYAASSSEAGPATSVAANSVTLGTDTVGNYAAGDAEAGNATSGDNAAGFFVTGLLDTARLGTGTADATTFLRGDQAYATPATLSHASTHQNAGADEISVAGLSGLLADAQTPLTHTHPASDIASGTIATARLGSGTADGTTFLRGDQTWDTPAGGGTPGGADTQVQFNDGGAFGGDAGLTYNKTTAALTAGQLNVDSLRLDGSTVSNPSGTDISIDSASGNVLLRKPAYEYDGANIYSGLNLLGVVVRSVSQFLFSSTTAATGTPDTGISRAAAGVAKITNGSSGNGTLEIGGSHCKGFTSTAAAATTTEYPTDKNWGFHKNTTTSVVSVVFNDGGVIKSVALA